MARKLLKIGVQVGGGRPPGYRWNLKYIDFARAEALDELGKDEAKYAYVAEQFQELAREVDPTHPVGLSVDSFNEHGFYELREKWGVLGRIAFRGFFVLDKTSRRQIVVIGGKKKEDNGPTPVGVVVTMGLRTRRYWVGEYGF